MNRKFFLLFRFALRFFLIGFLIGSFTFPHAQNLLAENLLTPQQRNLSTATPDQIRSMETMEDVIDRARFIRYSQDRWNEMRQRVESGEALIPELKPKAAPPKNLVKQPLPNVAGPGINVALPYQSGLSVTGRKEVAFNIAQTLYDQEDRGQGRLNKTDFTLDQQLQVRVKGTVGRKVTVNVDYDDTRDDKRDIYVVYKGDEDEILQEAAFGDITLSLPGTEFVNYSNSVFGLRAELLFRPRTGFGRQFPRALWTRKLPTKVKVNFIGSRTKGITETKRFKGRTEPQHRELRDIDYVRRTFYFIAFSSSGVTGTDDRPIKPGSEKIFLDDRNNTNNNIDETTRTIKVVETLLNSAGTQSASNSLVLNESTGVFKRLIPGIDYTVDYVKGVVRFIRTIQPTDVIAIDYVPSYDSRPISQLLGERDPLNPIGETDLGGYKPILLKHDESKFYASRELKTYYNLSAQHIVRDNGQGSFIMRITDLNNTVVTDNIVGLDVSTNTQIKPLLTYPRNADVDFDNGYLSFVTTDSFRTPLRPFTDDIYASPNADLTNLHRYNIFTEFSYEQGLFNLDRAEIVSQSERVYVDGRRMTRDVDYFIDYVGGTVNFFRADLINPDSVIEITYEYSPFGGIGQQTLVGYRTEFYFTENLYLGHTFIYNFQPRQQGVPDMRSMTNSQMVFNADLHWKDITFGSDTFKITELAGEFAQSIKNPNTAGKAMVESFEGANRDTAVNLNKDSWFIAATPQSFDRSYGNAISLTNEDASYTSILGGNAPVENSEQLQVLALNYDFQGNKANEAVSIAQVLSNNGIDFFTQRKQYIELWLHGDGKGNSFRIRYGRISEASDSSNTSTPKTEDTIIQDNALGPNEDVGWSFTNPDGTTTKIGAGNGILDTQDFDRNRTLDSDLLDGNYDNEAGIVPLIGVKDGKVHTSIDWTGWELFQIPLSIPTTGSTNWSSIKNVRFTVVRNSTISDANKSGSLKIGRLSAVGTRFQNFILDPSTAPFTASVFTEGNDTNPNYPSLISDGSYQDLYDLKDGSVKRRETALAFKYQRNALTDRYTTFYTYENLSGSDRVNTGFDFTTHKTFSYYLYGNGTLDTFFIRIGNTSDYYEFQESLNFTGWRKISYDITDSGRDGVMDSIPAQLKRVVGSPSLRSVSQLIMGTYISAGAETGEHKFYVNEIHLEESNKIVGQAYSSKADFSLKDWATWGVNWRFIDKNFSNINTETSGAGRTQRNGGGYFNLSRFTFMPLNTNFTYSEIETPKIQTLNDPNSLISILSEGRELTHTESVQSGLYFSQVPFIPLTVRSRLPNVNMSGDHSYTSRTLGGTDDREDELWSYRLGSSYAVPWRPDIIPGRKFMFKPLPTDLSASYNASRSQIKLKTDQTDTISKSLDLSLRSNFQFFPQFTLTPSYGYSKATESRNPLNGVERKALRSEVLETLGNINKSQNENLGLTGYIRVTNWFSPSFNYNSSIDESANVNVVTFGSSTFRRGEVKSINRNASGNITASLAPKDVFENIYFLKRLNPAISSLSFSGGYSISDSDSYEYVPEGFSSRYKFVVRGSPLFVADPNNPYARRNSLTASDTIRTSGRWNAFEGFTFMKSRNWEPIKNINTSGSFTETKTKRDTTGTLSDSYVRVWPDFIVTTSGLEYPLHVTRWMSETRISQTYQERLDETLGETRQTGKSQSSDFTFTLFKMLQFSLQYTDSIAETKNLQTDQVTQRTRSHGINGQVVTTLKWGNWRFTPRYDQSQSESEDGTGKKTSDLVNRNASLAVFGDVSVPRFFRLPLGKQLTLRNRLILNSNIRFNMVRDGVNENNSLNLLDANASGDLEITPNIRVAFGGGFQKTMHTSKKDEDFTVIQVNSRVTIQF